MMRIFKYAVDSFKQLSLPEVEEENAFKVTSKKTNFLKVKCIYFKNKVVQNFKQNALACMLELFSC